MKTNKGLEDEIMQKVFKYFRESFDCNGLDSLNLNLNCSEEELVNVICSLINEDKLKIIAFEHDENPHINRFGFPSKEMQISYLQKKRNGWKFLHLSVKYIFATQYGNGFNSKISISIHDSAGESST